MDSNLKERAVTGLAKAGIAWLAGGVLTLILQVCSPDGVVRDAGLPVWSRVSLMATEILALGVLAAAGTIFLGLVALRSSKPRTARVATVALLTVIVAAAAGSWAFFWLSGQFLDGEGARFLVTNPAAVFRAGFRSHPFVTILLALAPVAAAVLSPVLICAVDRVARAQGKWLAAGTGILFVASCGGALGGEIARNRSRQTLMDDRTETQLPLTVIYGVRRQRHTGPLCHLAAWFGGRSRGVLFEDGLPGDLYSIYARSTGRTGPAPLQDLLDDGPSENGADLVRRPLVPLDRYLAGVDRQRLKRWNVVLVWLDSLRADQITTTGGRRTVMPAVEALAREGRSFSDCYTQVSHTDLSVGSLVSSHYPLRGRWRSRCYKDPSYPRVFIYDILRPLGWRTAYFASGDDRWCEMMEYLQTDGLETVVHAGTPDNPEVASAMREPYTRSIDDRVTVDGALRWIERSPQTPFFLTVGLQSGHLPFPVPPDFPRRFGPARIDFPIDAATFPKEKAGVAMDLYADGLAYADLQLDHLFRRLRELGLWDRTVVIVTGDHGEAFYEHGGPAHANGIDEEVMRVPLIVRAPDLVPDIDARPTQLIDVAPSLFGLLNLPSHPSFQGEDLFSAPLRPDRPRFLLCQTGISQVGVVRRGFKFVREGTRGMSALYDLTRDPGQTVDVSAQHPEETRLLRALLGRWRRSQLDYYRDRSRQAVEYPPIFRP